MYMAIALFSTQGFPPESVHVVLVAGIFLFLYFCCYTPISVFFWGCLGSIYVVFIYSLFAIICVFSIPKRSWHVENDTSSREEYGTGVTFWH